jgi:hypothetical protein
MPATTPIYAFPYPCVGEAVNFADFASLANAIDAKYLDLQADTDLALGRYNANFNVAAQAGIAVGVDTVMANPNATYVIPADGVYLVFGNCNMQTATTITSARFRVRLNGVQIFGRTFNFQYGNLNTEFAIPPAPLICATGDTISFTFLYQGTGTATVSFNYVPRMITRIA